MNTDLIASLLPGYIIALFDSYDCSLLLYHNLRHTQKVVLHTTEIARHYGLDNRSFFILQAAAWFHDTGQLAGDMAVHEERSVQFMLDFFSGKSDDNCLVNEIAACIMSTKMPVDPRNQLEEILCDADTYHLGTTDFQLLDPLVWQELELRLGKPIPQQAEKSLVFLEEHRFYTSYCRQLLTPGKKKNIALLKTIIRNRSAE